MPKRDNVVKYLYKRNGLEVEEEEEPMVEVSQIPPNKLSGL